MTHTTTSLAMGLNAEYEYHHVVHRMITDGFLFFLKVIFTVCMSNVCHAGSSRDAPATSQYFSQRAIVSLHNSTFSKQRWHLKKKKKKKRWQIAVFTYLVQPKCFCSVFAARWLTASRHTRCTPGHQLGLAWWRWRWGLNCRPHDQ